MFLTDMSCLLVAVTAGALAGRLIGWIGSTLPARLFRSWHREALEILSAPADSVKAVSYRNGADQWRWTVPVAITATAAVVIYYGCSPLSIGLGGLAWGLLLLAVIDAEHQLLPDIVVIPLLWIGLLANASGLLVNLHDAVVGAVSGYGALWLISWVFKLVTGRDGLGGGDMKMLGMLGAWGGWQVLCLIVLFASLAAAVIEGLRQCRSADRSKSAPFSFGPYLAAAGFIGVCWGEQITDWYMRLAAA